MILFYFKIDRIWDLFFLSFDNKILILRPQRKIQCRTSRFVFLFQPIRHGVNAGSKSTPLLIQLTIEFFEH